MRYTLLTTVFLAASIATAVSGAPAAKPAKVKAAVPSGKVFASPQDAAQALVEAAATNNVQALLEILGPDSQKLVESGDAVQDKNSRAVFAKLAKASMRVEPDPHHEGDQVIIVGEDDWPMPIPIAKTAAGWQFDTAAGADEIINRRVGDNELEAIEICRGLVDAQFAYASKDRDSNGLLEYAQRFISTPGNQDGLYWPTEPDGSSSPIADVVAKAGVQGYDLTTGKPAPFHGYIYRILTEQGPSAPGGAYSYVVRGAMIGGFAFVAWPAEYGASGVMTFIINNQGNLYEKDLGPKTAELVKAMKAYNPDKTWRQIF